eukprot:m.804186 g.804186  ORF g.804186 m.804186 type:complete len:125 (+) comp23368_c0_seq15:134-508(+)
MAHVEREHASTHAGDEESAGQAVAVTAGVHDNVSFRKQEERQLAAFRTQQQLLERKRKEKELEQVLCSTLHCMSYCGPHQWCPLTFGQLWRITFVASAERMQILFAQPAWIGSEKCRQEERHRG